MGRYLYIIEEKRNGGEKTGIGDGDGDGVFILITSARAGGSSGEEPITSDERLTQCLPYQIQPISSR